MYKFGDIDVVLLDFQPHVRRVMKFALNELGITGARARECGDVDAVRAAVKESDPDILILDIDEDRENVCDLATKIRNEQLGSNPFMIITATTWNPERNVIRDALDAGVDDIVAKPISVEIMSRRMENLIENRKQFVATSSYVGPNRRDSRPLAEGGPNMVSVPNTLRAKATGDMSAALDRDAMQKALDAIALQRAQRLALDVAEAAVILKGQIEGSVAMPIFREKLTRASDLVARLADYVEAELDTTARQVSSSMTELTAALQTIQRPEPEQFELLKLHGQALAAMLLGTDGSATLVADALRHAAGVRATAHAAGGESAEMPAAKSDSSSAKPVAEPLRAAAPVLST